MQPPRVSVLFNEPKLLKFFDIVTDYSEAVARFSALQRAEIAEISACEPSKAYKAVVSVLFNEPKLLK